MTEIAESTDCIIVAGNCAQELLTTEKTRSFELVRSSLKDVQIVTFDELFGRIEALLKVLGQGDAVQAEPRVSGLP
jgi:hypothetical protein